MAKNNIKYTIEEVKNICKKYGFELISKEYINNKQNLIMSDENLFLYFSRLSDLMKGKNPVFAQKSNPYSIYNIKLFCKINSKKFKLLSNTYEGANDNLLWKCLKEECGEIFKSSWHNIFNGQGCGICHGKQVGISNCLATKNPELSIEWHPTLNCDLTPYDVTFGSHKEVWWKCQECSHEWSAIIYSRSNKGNGCGCPECSKSKGEKRIKEWLKQNSIINIAQKEFDKLIGLGNGNLSYDFYLPQYNLLIEYQGEQHKKYIKGLHKNKKDFEKQLEHDRKKRQYAEDNNIRLLEIWYYDFDKIEEILESTILELKDINNII